MTDDETRDHFTSPDPDRERAARAHTSLFRIAERHASTPDARARHSHPELLAPHEAVRLMAMLAGGVIDPMDGEPSLDEVDLVAALSLLPLVRAEVDEMEAGLIMVARGRGMSWSRIAFALGLRTAQAAQQRADRLAVRGERRADDAG
jgi:hypothetical protein